MNPAEKVYTIVRRDGKVYTGTFAELSKQLRIILIAGQAYNQRIKFQPENIQRLVRHLNMAVRVSQKTKGNAYTLETRKGFAEK